MWAWRATASRLRHVARGRFSYTDAACSPWSWPHNRTHLHTSVSRDRDSTHSSNILTSKPVAIRSAECGVVEPSRGAVARPWEGVSYSGCGWLLTFHAGATDTLLQADVLQPEPMYYGVSGGSIVAVAMAIGTEPEELLRIAFSTYDETPRGIKIWARVDEILQKKFGDLFPDDAHTLCSGRVGIGVTRVWPSPKSLMITEFESKDDLISTVIASCFVPGYIDGSLMRRYRDCYAIDGGVGQVFPNVPNTVPVFPFPSMPTTLKYINFDGIAPSLLPEPYPFTLPELLRGALIPFDEKNHRKLFECGQRCAEVWLERQARQPPPA
eukprot:m.142539 g.142539  ORF g.142539 m.142539 type:complete len:325 (-) comp22929_c0_seq1:103-1077(-)